MTDLPRFKDTAHTTLSSGSLQGATSLIVTSITALTDNTDKPSYVTIWDSSAYTTPTSDPEMEVVKVTAWDSGTNTITISSGLSYGHAAGERVSLLVSAAPMNDIAELVETNEAEVATKQDTLVSGTNIKTINGLTVLGEGDVVIVGAGLIAPNLYPTIVDSDVSGYKKLSYDVPPTETIVSGVIAGGSTTLLANYLYPYPVLADEISGGTWVFHAYMAVSSALLVTQMRIQVFLRHADTSETNLFSADSDEINAVGSSNLELYAFESSQAAFSCAQTDRVGFRVYGITTSSTAVTLYWAVGGQDSAYAQTPLTARHNSLRGRDQAEAHPADAITYDGTTSGLTATDVQAAVDEVKGDIPTALGDLSGTLDDITDGLTYVKSTNDYTDAEKSKLGGIEAGAEVNTVDSVNGATGVVVLTQDNVGDGTTYKRYSATEQSKLAGIEAGADVTDATNVAAAGAVMTSGDQSVAGVKTFGSFPVTPSSAPTTDYQVANKKYVDDTAAAGGLVSSVNGYTGAVVLDQDDIADGVTYVQYSATEKTKLAGIEAGAEVNLVDSVNTQTGAVVLDADDLADGTTNVMMLATERTKLTGIEAGAEVNLVDSVNGQTGVVVLDQDDVGDGSTYVRYSAAEQTKLAGIETGAVKDIGNATGTLSTDRLSTVAGTYSVDPLAPVTGAVHNQLNTPSIMEVAASNMFLENKMLLVVPDVVKYSDDNGANWYDTTWTANQIADLMLGRYSNSYCTIDRSWTNVKFEWTASVVGMDYFTLNFLYLYTSTRGNTMKLLIEKQDNDTDVWSTVTETAYWSSWPAHQWIPHDSIAFDDNTTHYKAVRLTFTPSWDSATEAIRIHQIDWWGAYPANYQNRIWSWDRDGLITINGGLYVSGNITLSGTVDGRDVATDGTKLDGIEAAADVTDATNVAAAGAVMNTGDETVAGVKTFSSSPIVPTPTTDYQSATKKYVDDNIGSGAVDSVNGYTGVVVLDADDIADGTTNKAYTATEQTKLSGVETGATNIANYRNTAITNGVAGIYNPCKTLVDEHIPSCVVHYEFFGSVLDGTYNPDSWYPINGNGSVSYSTRVLTYSTLTAVSAAARTVIDQETYSMGRNYLSFVVRLSSMATGAGGTRNTAIGFQPAFSSFYSTNRATFFQDSDGDWYCGYNGGSTLVSSLTIGRNLQAGDVIEVRLCRVEGSSNIDKVCFYVNNAKQLEMGSAYIPTSACYAGIGVYGDTSVTTARTLGVSYVAFMMKF